MQQLVYCRGDQTEAAAHHRPQRRRSVWAVWPCLADDAAPVGLLTSRPATACMSHHLRRSASFDGSEVGAKICGADLGAMYSGAEVPTTSTPPRISYCAWLGTSELRFVAPRRVTSTP